MARRLNHQTFNRNPFCEKHIRKVKITTVNGTNTAQIHEPVNSNNVIGFANNIATTIAMTLFLSIWGISVIAGQLMYDLGLVIMNILGTTQDYLFYVKGALLLLLFVFFVLFDGFEVACCYNARRQSYDCYANK